MQAKRVDSSCGCARFSTALLAIALGVLCPSNLAAGAPPATSPATRPIIFSRPSLETPIFDTSKMKWPATQRANCADWLAAFVTAETRCDTPEEGRRAVRALGIALRLDPRCRRAVLTVARLARGEGNVPPQQWDPKLFRTLLGRFAQELKAAGTPDDLACAALLYDLLFDLQIDNLQALREAEALHLAGYDAQWTLVEPLTGPLGTLTPRIRTNGDLARPLFTLGQFASAPSRQSALSRDGRFLFTTIGDKDPAIRMWDVATGRQLREFRGHTLHVTRISLSADDRLMATCSADGSVRVWDLVGGKEIRQITRAEQRNSKETRPIPTPVHRNSFVALTPDGSRLYYLDGAQVRCVQPISGQPVSDPVPPSLDTPIWRFSPSGQLLCTRVTDGLSIWDMSKNRVLCKISDTQQNVHARWLAFSPDEQQVLICDKDKIYWWDIVNNKEGRLQAKEPGVMAASADGRLLLRMLDSGVRVVDAMTGKAVLDTGNIQHYQGAISALSASGEVCVVSGGTSLYVYGVAPPAPVEPGAISLAAQTAKKPLVEDPRVRTSTLKLPVSLTRNGTRFITSCDLIARYGERTLGNGMITEDPVEMPMSEGNDIRTLVHSAGNAFSSKYEGFGRRNVIHFSLGRRDIDFNLQANAWSGQAAALLLLLSINDGVELDPKTTVIGTCGENWELKRRERWFAQMTVAMAAEGAKTIIVPSQPTEWQTDILLLQGSKTFWDAQIFGVETIAQALQLAAVQRDAKVQEAMAAFQAVRQSRESRPNSPLSNEDRAGLKKVLALAPNHVSAAALLKWADSRQSLRLSKEAFEYTFERAVNRFTVSAGDSPYPPWESAGRLKREGIEQVRSELRKLLPMAADEYKPLIKLQEGELDGMLLYIKNINNREPAMEATKAVIAERARVGLSRERWRIPSGY